MDCQHCCGADQLFDLKGAKKEIRRYRKKGAHKSTNLLLQNLVDNKDIANKTLLDIGGGIGAIQWFFLRNGAVKTTDIDASTAYLQTARDYALENGWEVKSRFIMGDFSQSEKQIDPHDYVTLDKVICCYPDYRALLERAIESCRDRLAITYPVRNIISRFLVFIAGLYFRLKKNPFRTYNHPPHEVEQFIRSKGFTPVYLGISFPWHVQVFRRT
jgi:magnesium-protoporphyrin O-methyltransferase